MLYELLLIFLLRTQQNNSNSSTSCVDYPLSQGLTVLICLPWRKCKIQANSLCSAVWNSFYIILIGYLIIRVVNKM
jgi:hypothetical protein